MDISSSTIYKYSEYELVLLAKYSQMVVKIVEIGETDQLD